MFARLARFAQGFEARSFVIDGEDTPLRCAFRLLMAYRPETYERIDQLTDYFSECERLRACVRGQPLSPWCAWQRSSRLRAEVRRRAPFGSPPQALREALYQLGPRQATSFKATFALSVLRQLGSRRVLDPCAGWGDRMVAAMAVPVTLYVGIDPNDRLRSCHARARRFCSAASTTQVHMLPSPFEDARLDFFGKFDTVFTSPPYYDFERYSEAASQSVSRHPTFDGWLRNWLFVFLAKAWRLLEVGGHMAIHMCQPCIWRHMIAFCEQELPGCRLAGILACDASRVRPVFVFTKRRINASEMFSFLSGSSAWADESDAAMPSAQSTAPAARSWAAAASGGQKGGDGGRQGQQDGLQHGQHDQLQDGRQRQLQDGQQGQLQHGQRDGQLQQDRQHGQLQDRQHGQQDRQPQDGRHGQQGPNGPQPAETGRKRRRRGRRGGRRRQPQQQQQQQQHES